MWLTQKPIHITTPIGHEELDPVHPTSNQTPILEGPGSFVIIGLGYHPKQEPTTVNIELCSPPPDVI